MGKLTPENTVFLLCDIQTRFRPLTWKGETVINTARYMTSVAKALNIPVVITQQYTKVFGDTVSDCFADPEDIKKYPVVEKKQFSMCVDEVNKELKELNKPSVVLFGIEAHVCVQQTCLDLMEQGKEVHLILDGTSSQQAYVSRSYHWYYLFIRGARENYECLTQNATASSHQDREIALQRMSQAGAFVTTAQSAAFMLMQTAEHENFKTVSKLTVEHMKLPNEFNEDLTGKL